MPFCSLCSAIHHVLYFLNRISCIHINFIKYSKTGRRICLMVSVLVSGLSGPGSSMAVHSLARHFTLTVPLSIQMYKMGTIELDGGGSPVMD